MNEQPEALLLADELDAWGKVLCGSLVMATATVKLRQAAAELRRLKMRDQHWEATAKFMQKTMDRMESDLQRLFGEKMELMGILSLIAETDPVLDSQHAVRVSKDALAKYGVKE